ncbi:hypothetical protein EDD85DRAFT_841732 [Armillaria nabsnona]|nr:hypothetical protein EDD85DRAFT_841732 [Armillaria nabsnona]
MPVFRSLNSAGLMIALRAFSALIITKSLRGMTGSALPYTTIVALMIIGAITRLTVMTASPYSSPSSILRPHTVTIICCLGGVTIALIFNMHMD